MSTNNKLSGLYDDLFGKESDSKNQPDQPYHVDITAPITSGTYQDALVSVDKESAPDSQQEKCPEVPTPDAIQQQIQSLIGLERIKSDLDTLMDFIKVQKLRRENNLSGNDIVLHTAFIGNPGTGKTTVARLMGRYFQAIGLLKKGHLIEVTRADLVAEFVGGTAAKTNKVIDSALDGILFIDEAYSLSNGSANDYGKEAINILVDRMEKERHRLAVFVAGYDKEMSTFFDSNSGLASRIARKFYFEDYNGQELMEIFKLRCKENQYQLDEEAMLLIQTYLDYIYFVRDDNFGNGREVRNLFEKLIQSQADRIADAEQVNAEMLMTFTKEDITRAIPVTELIVNDQKLEHVMDELNELIGLAPIKEHIINLISLVKTNQKREAAGLPVKSMTYHAIFSGAPGTGKTTIARLIGKIYKTLGILKKGHLIEVDRSGLIGGYVGQTEEKTNKVIDSALDGILFIDEAYSLLGGGNDYGQKAIETLLKRMEDHRDRLIVIIAGYTGPMNLFIASNPGLKDRFTLDFEFPSYSSEELLQMFLLQAKHGSYTLQLGATDLLRKHLEQEVSQADEFFGNGRFIRNLFEKLVLAQAKRISKLEDPTKEEMSKLTVADLSCLNV